MRKVAVRLGLSIVIAAILVHWLVSQGFDVLPSMETISSNTSISSILIYVGLFAVFHLLRAWRWQYLLGPFVKVPTRTMLEVAFAGFVAIQMMPLRTGEIARPYLLDRYTGASKSALLGTIAIERVVDGIMVSIWLTIALFLATNDLPPYALGLKFIPLSIFVVALVLLIAFYKKPVAIRGVMDKILRPLSSRLADFTVGVLERFHEGLAALPNIRNFWTFVIISALYWSINAVAFFILAMGCGLALPLAGAVAGMGCLAVGILLPAGPGYFGNFQVAVLAALTMYLPSGFSEEGAAVFVFLLYALQTGLTILFGAIGALGLVKKRRIN